MAYNLILSSHMQRMCFDKTIYVEFSTEMSGLGSPEKIMLLKIPVYRCRVSLRLAQSYSPDFAY